jgi:hypothetical protein
VDATPAPGETMTPLASPDAMSPEETSPEERDRAIQVLRGLIATELIVDSDSPDSDFR